MLLKQSINTKDFVDKYFGKGVQEYVKDLPVAVYGLCKGKQLTSEFTPWNLCTQNCYFQVYQSNFVGQGSFCRRYGAWLKAYHDDVKESKLA